MKRFWAPLLGLFLVCPNGFSQNPPGPNPPTRPPSRPSAPTRPSIPVRQNIRVVGRIFPAQGENKLPDLMTVSIASITGGYFKIGLVQGSSFEFKDLPPGRYRIKLESPGYEDARQELDAGELGPGSTHFVSMLVGPRERSPDEIDPTQGSTTIDAQILAIPPNAAKEMRKAIEASAKGDSGKAVQHLLKAVKIHPGYSEAYNNLAVQYVKLGQVDEAVRTFEKSVEVRPTAKAYFNLGILHYQKNRRREAASALDRASRLDASDAAVLRALAEVYFKMGQYLLAVKSYRRLDSLKPDPQTHLSIGYCFLRLQMPDHARPEFEHYLREEPTGDGAARVRDILAQLESSPR